MAVCTADLCYSVFVIVAKPSHEIRAIQHDALSTADAAYVKGTSREDIISRIKTVLRAANKKLMSVAARYSVLAFMADLV